MPPSTDDLAAVDDELWAALLHGDAGAVEALADPEASVEHPALGVWSAEELVRELRTGRLRVAEAEIERRRLRITGELATTTTIVTVAGTREGAPFRTRLRWICTWRLAAAWVLVAASSAPPRDGGAGGAAGRR